MWVVVQADVPESKSANDFLESEKYTFHTISEIDADTWLEAAWRAVSEPNGDAPDRQLAVKYGSPITVYSTTNSSVYVQTETEEIKEKILR